MLHVAKSSSCHQDHRDVARAANAREARLFTNVMRGQKAAHHHDIFQRTGACKLCSSALLGEELCFRHTTILGSCRDLTALAAPLPRRPYSLFGLFDGCAVFSGLLALATAEEAWASARIDKRAFRPSMFGGPIPSCFLKSQNGLTVPCAAAGRQGQRPFE